MPIYTYKCRDCGIDVEQRQSYSDDPLSVCHTCGGVLRRTLHSVGIIFKGSGFYNTDYKRSATSNGESTAEAKDGIKADATKDGIKADGSQNGTAKTTSDSTAESAKPASNDSAATATPAKTD